MTRQLNDRKFPASVRLGLTKVDYGENLGARLDKQDWEHRSASTSAVTEALVRPDFRGFRIDINRGSFASHCSLLISIRATRRTMEVHSTQAALASQMLEAMASNGLSTISTLPFRISSWNRTVNHHNIN